jgi:hypothetical protein
MNKLVLVLALLLFGCAQNQPTREIVNCQREYMLGDDTLFVGGSRAKDGIECQMVRVPLLPKSTPLPVDPRLIDKSVN